MAKDVPWKSCSNWWNTDTCLAGAIPERTKCPVMLPTNSSGVFANGTGALVNGTASLVNATLSNCTSPEAKNYTSPSLEYWE